MRIFPARLIAACNFAKQRDLPKIIRETIRSRMPPLLFAIVMSSIAFAATNIDDIFDLALFSPKRICGRAMP